MMTASLQQQTIDATKQENGMHKLQGYTLADDFK
jgi:hypothetical protein